MDAAAGTRPLRASFVVVGVLFAMLTAAGSVAWVEWRSRTAVDRPQMAPTAITDELFARVDEGMRPAEVAAVLGRPSRRTTSLAEGFAWPEPKDVCWYFPSVDRLREYQVCFVAWKLVTRGSYPIAGGG
jgi:hypothetical protein